MSNLSRAQIIASLCALSFDVTPFSATAQTKPPIRRLAIVCDAADPGSEQDANRLQSRAGGALLKSGRYAIVDRAKLDRLLREQGLSNSDYADPSTAAKLGKLAGAEQLLNLDFTESMEADRGAFVVTSPVTSRWTLLWLMSRPAAYRPPDRPMETPKTSLHLKRVTFVSALSGFSLYGGALDAAAPLTVVCIASTTAGSDVIAQAEDQCGGVLMAQGVHVADSSAISETYHEDRTRLSCASLVRGLAGPQRCIATVREF